MANSTLSVANTDFASIKASLKTFLTDQPNFKDFNFEGSNLSTLLDVLSYNTFMQNFYLLSAQKLKSKFPMKPVFLRILIILY